MMPEDFLRIINKGEAVASLLLGKIPANYTSGRPAVLFDGETVAGTRLYPYISSYTPTANDRVIVAVVGHGGVVLGKII